MTGLTLPLLSTGSSSLLATFLALGLASHHEASLDRDAFRPYSFGGRVGLPRLSPEEPGRS